MYNIGIDLGGTSISAAIISQGKIVSDIQRLATPVGADNITDALAAIINSSIENSEFSLSDITSIGIGVPGSIYPSETVSFACNIGMSDYPLSRKLREYIDKPIHLENDANCAALAEYRHQNATSLFMMTLGTGIGGAYIEDGRILRGHNGCALEVGHSVIVCGGRSCSCGRSGCFEAYASTVALMDMIGENLDNSAVLKQLHAQYGSLDARIIFDAMAQNDSLAFEIFERYCRYLACGMTNLINIFQPEILCVGGAISAQGERLLAPVREIIMSENYSRYMDINTKIMTSTLGNDAGIIGAGLLHSIGANNANC